jgi:hypothetical protein
MLFLKPEPDHAGQFGGNGAVGLAIKGNSGVDLVRRQDKRPVGVPATQRALMGKTWIERGNVSSGGGKGLSACPER